MRYGVVEDIKDPLEAGRIRVRIFGLHTDDTNLIPTDSLPWAMCLTPIQSASISGIGISPTGILPGTWVGIDFMDSDEQYPIVVGTIPGFPIDETKKAVVEELSFTESTLDDKHILKDADGATVTDSDGNPIKTGEPTEPKPTLKKPVPIIQENASDPGRVIPSKLGSISEKAESGGRGPGVINSYSSGADLGGASYGVYQFASYLKGPGVKTKDSDNDKKIRNSPIKKYLRSSKYSMDFEGLEPATPEFDSLWKTIAASDSDNFRKDQHDYIEREYYQSAIAKLPSAITYRRRAVHEAIWSMSVQLGPSGAANTIIAAVGTNPDISICDDKLCEVIYNHRLANVQTQFASSPKLWPGLISRFESEKKALMALAKTYETGVCGEVKEVIKEEIEYTEETKELVETKQLTTTVPYNPGIRGFVDPSGIYPKRYNEPDVSRLARGVITDTCIEKKRRALLKRREAGYSVISEPQTQFNAKYPYNKVTETISGHVIELDDTPGYERVHIFHSSNSFIEIHPNGSYVVKSKKDIHMVASEDVQMIADGSLRAHIGADAEVSIMNNLTIRIHGNTKINVDGNADIGVMGNAKMRVKGNFDTAVGKDATMVVNGKYTIKAKRIDLNPESGSFGINVDDSVNFDADVIMTEIDDASEEIVNKTIADAIVSGKITVEQIDAGKEAVEAPIKQDTKKPDPPKAVEETSCSVFDSGVTDSIQLSRHFNVGMLSSKAAVSHYTISDNNGLSASEIACNLKFLAVNSLDPIKDQYPNMFVTSAFRSGTGSSQHTLGQAADMQFRGTSKAQYFEIAKWIRDNVEYDKLLLEYKTTGTGQPWIHITFKRNGNAKAVYTYMNDKNAGSGLLKLQE
jgi:hypothetical protein